MGAGRVHGPDGGAGAAYRRAGGVRGVAGGGRGGGAALPHLGVSCLQGRYSVELWTGKREKNSLLLKKREDCIFN